jgi:hypothetical protein
VVIIGLLGQEQLFLNIVPLKFKVGLVEHLDTKMKMILKMVTHETYSSFEQNYNRSMLFDHFCISLYGRFRLMRSLKKSSPRFDIWSSCWSSDFAWSDGE